MFLIFEQKIFVVMFSKKSLSWRFLKNLCRDVFKKSWLWCFQKILVMMFSKKSWSWRFLKYFVRDVFYIFFATFKTNLVRDVFLLKSSWCFFVEKFKRLRLFIPYILLCWVFNYVFLAASWLSWTTRRTTWSRTRSTSRQVRE